MSRRREAERRAAETAAAADEMRLRVQAARAEALSEARRGFEMEMEMKLVEERKRLDRVRVEFARDRQRFFAAAESQVVKLALAVARKILHRDAIGEGLPLRATVKAALARVQDGSSTVLRVPSTEIEAWSAMFAGGAAGKIEVVGDDRMVEGECVLETSVGRVELGQDAQMEEVERGFGELMQEQGY
jgi:flagellar assembly protein FliH